MTKRSENKLSHKFEGSSDDTKKCGIIMPISKSKTHSAEHWSDVQLLLHRCVINAGFQPENVWEGDATDRISEKIVGNIFAYEIAVADASDLNPNVMLEIGLRLASKKPTVVVTDNLNELPFDIRDFRSLEYPSDLNILGMEKFFIELDNQLNSKYTAFKNENYKPFLNDIVVEVVTPSTKSTSIDDAILDRLDSLTRSIARIETISRSSPKSNAWSMNADSIYFKMPIENYKQLERERISSAIMFGVKENEGCIISELRIRNSSSAYKAMIEEVITSKGGTILSEREFKSLVTT